MKAFVINLGSATRRWTAMETAFARTPFEIQRIAAVDGATLQFPLEDYAERRFHWFHGRKTNPGEVGCYLSHVLAMRMFLKTNDSHGLICEDDIVLRPEFSEVVAAALLAPQRWNILRLTGLSTGNPVGLGRLCGDYRLCISLGRIKGTGAYIIDRTAAEALVKGLLPMWLPFDHALDREWRFGLRSACVLPFPCSQTEAGFRSSIQKADKAMQPAYRRWFGTYPYQASNEISRWLTRGGALLGMRGSK